jgi:hypothetical protein
MMADRFTRPEIGNRECQRDLAHALLAAHGRDEALEICQQNGWEGVLDVLLSDRRVSSNSSVE